MSEDKDIQETLAQLKDADEKVRSQAALSLGWMGNLEVIAPLIETLSTDISSKVRANAAMSLGQLNDEKAIQPLIQALEDNDSFVRGMAIYSLGLMKAKDAIMPLIKIIEKENDKEALIAASDSLAQIGDERAIMPLIKLFVYKSELRDDVKDSLNKICKTTGFKKLEQLIKEEMDKKEAVRKEEQQIRQQKIIKEMQKKELDLKRKEIIETISIELPKMLEYAIHEEVIPFENLCKKFNCDDFLLEFTLTKLKDEKAIDVLINSTNKSFTVLKPKVKLSDEAKYKLRLLRKKFGIDW